MSNFLHSFSMIFAFIMGYGLAELGLALGKYKATGMNYSVK